MGAKTSIEWTRGDDGQPGASWNPELIKRFWAYVAVGSSEQCWLWRSRLSVQLLNRLT